MHDICLLFLNCVIMPNDCQMKNRREHKQFEGNKTQAFVLYFVCLVFDGIIECSIQCSQSYFVCSFLRSHYVLANTYRKKISLYHIERR